MKPSYFAIITADVRYSDIPPNAKLLYGELTALTSKEGFCWANNRYFSELYGVDTRTITRWIADLEEKGFIRSEVSIQLGNRRKIWLTIDKNVHTSRQKCPSLYISNTNKKGESKDSLPYEVVSDKPTKQKVPQDRTVWKLRDKLYDLFEKETGVRPTTHAGDYINILNARKRMSEKEIYGLVEDALGNRKPPRTVREALTARAIDIYLQDNS